MRVLVTATMAASALAIGLTMEAAQSAPLGSPSSGNVGTPDAAVQQAQDKGGGGGRGSGMGGSGQGGGPSMGGGGGKSMQGGGGAVRGDGGGGGGLRQGGSQFRSGERGMRGDGGGRGGVEFGFRERGGRDFDRSRGDRDRRRFGGRDFDRDDRGRRRFGGRGGIYFGPSYGYLPAGCAWLRQRALETDSPYWWRRYRACRGAY